MFLIEITYTRPIEEIEAKTAEHRAWLDGQIADGLLILTGPKVPRTGGFLIARGGKSLEEVAAIMKQDPFAAHGLADYRIVEFAAGRMNPALADFV
jgi:uncharacterized protein YciI